MNKLQKQTKIKIIQKEAEKHSITAYEFGKETQISTLAARKILNGETKNPNENTLNEMLLYIERRIVGTNISNEKNIAAEEPLNYQTKHNELLAAIQNLETILTKDLSTISDGVGRTFLNTKSILTDTKTIKNKGTDIRASITKLEAILRNG